MSDTATKLTYLNTTKTLIKDGINSIGGELTSSDTFRSYAEELEQIYEDLPKVSGSGETLTLEPTKKGKMEIELKGNTYQYSTTGKNLANTKVTSWSYLGVDISYDDTTQVLTINGTSTGNAILSFQNYNFSNINASNGERINLVVEYISGSATSNDNGRITLSDTNYTMSMSVPLNGINTTKTEYRNISSSLTYNNLGIAYRTGDVYNNLKIKIMVCKGSDTTYEPYTNGASPNPDYPQDIQVVSGDNTIIVSNGDNTQSQSYPIQLGDIELCKIGDYQDYIYKDSGKWYKHSEIGKVVLDGSENNPAINTDKTNTTRIYYNYDLLQYNALNVAGISNRLTYYVNWNEDVQGYYFNSNQKNLIFRMNKSSIGTTIGELNTYLASNNLIVYYVLATPTTTEITDSTLLSQLEAIKYSYNEQTNISQENDDLSAILDVSALLDTNTYIDHLEAEVEALS